MLVLPRLFHVPCRRAYAKQSFNLTQKLDRFNRQRTRLCNSLTSLFGKFRFHDTERVAPVQRLPHVEHAAIADEWKHWCLCNFSHGIYIYICFQLHHTSSRKCYNTLLRDLIDYKCEVVEWFCPSSRSKASHGGQQVEDRALVIWLLGGSRLFRAPTANAVTKMPSQWLGNEVNNPSKYAHILLPDELTIILCIIRLNWLCQNHNLVGLSQLEAPVASEIIREVGWFLVSQDVNTTRKCP